MTSRYLEAEIDGIRIASLYLPNGNPAPGPKFSYKLKWFERLQARAQELLALKSPVILAGDFNVMPTEIDVYPLICHCLLSAKQGETRTRA